MTEQDFIQAIEREPGRTLELIYADWLDEQGNPSGQAIRLMHERYAEIRELVEAAYKEGFQAAIPTERQNMTDDEILQAGWNADHGWLLSNAQSQMVRLIGRP